MSVRVGQQLGNYRLIELLGQGGFAQVYLGEHVYLGTQAAIKVLQTQLTNVDIEQFQSEARTIASLEHPYIVRVLEFGVDGTTPFLVMSYAPHGTLRTRHPKGTLLPLSTVISYADLCLAHATHFSNFAFQVQMTIIKGDAGGLVFRADTTGAIMYRFSADQDGVYDLISTDASNNIGRLISLKSTSAIKTGLNQVNLLAVIARGNQIYLYINGQYVDSAIDSRLSSGEIGLFAYDHGDPTEVAYSNAKVWTL